MSNMKNENSGLKVFVSNEVFDFRALEEHQTTKSQISRAYSQNAITVSNNKEVCKAKDRRTIRPEKKLVTLYGSSHCLSSTKHTRHKGRSKGEFRRSHTRTSNGVNMSQSASDLINPEPSCNSSENNVNCNTSHLTNTSIQETENQTLNPLLETVDMLKRENSCLKRVKRNGKKNLSFWIRTNELLNNADDGESNNQFLDDIDNNRNDFNDKKCRMDRLKTKGLSIRRVSSSITIPLLTQHNVSHSDIDLCEECTDHKKKLTVYRYDDTSICNLQLFRNPKKESKLLKIFYILLGSACGIFLVSLMAWFIIENHHQILQYLSFKEVIAKPQESAIVLVLKRSGAIVKYTWGKLCSTVHDILVFPRGDVLKHQNTSR